MNWIRTLGASALFILRGMGRMGLFFSKTCYYLFRPPLKISWVLKQIWFIGAQSTLVIFITGAFAGMVLGLQGYYTLNSLPGL